jgi:hypothetical protein
MYVQSGLCNVVCVCCVGCCASSSYRCVGRVSRSGLMGVVEKIRFGDRHPFIVLGLNWGVRLFVLPWVCVLCLYRAKAAEPFSHSVNIDYSCHVGCQCTS